MLLSICFRPHPLSYTPWKTSDNHLDNLDNRSIVTLQLMEKKAELQDKEVTSALQKLQIVHSSKSGSVNVEAEYIILKPRNINAKAKRRHRKKMSKNKTMEPLEQEEHDDKEAHVSPVFSEGSNEEESSMPTSGCTSGKARQKKKPHRGKALLNLAVTGHKDAIGELLDGQTAREEMEDKLNQCIDSLTEKRAETRLAALKLLQQAFSSRVLHGFLIERCLTITYSLERSLKKGSGEEQATAATVFTLLCVQLGSGHPAEEGFKMLCPLFTAILTESRASVAARQSCARALGICCYVSACEEDSVKSMALLESIFMSSYPNRDGMLPTPTLGSPDIHSAALQAWALLVTLCPASRLIELLDLHLPKLQACLESNDTNYRIAVGETIALLVELRRDMDKDFKVEESEILCQCLKSLATDSNKYRAKADRRMQRSVFREVLHYIENENFTEEEIQFSVESIYINSWMRRRVYNAFKQILESGVTHHLQFNTILRDIFSLCDPLILDHAVRDNKISHSERHLLKSAAKARTKERNETRDKRAVFM